MEEIYCFAGNPLDRVSQRRQDAGWVASLLEDPATRLLPLHGLKPQIRHNPQPREERVRKGESWAYDQGAGDASERGDANPR